jgi:mannose-6-phosphate isomerase-like protein (cupin superfamily)
VFTREDLSKARADKNICLVRAGAHTNVKWDDLSSIYDNADEKNITYASFSSLIIGNTEKYTDKYQSILESLSKIHGGKLVGINSIVHFFNRNNDTLEDDAGLSMRNNFVSRNPEKREKESYTFEQLGPSIHVDAADGFFIQNEGSTLWKIYRDSGVTEYTLTEGDIMYIPKYTIHSVESLNPRHSASIVFKDSQVFVCKHCGSLNI